ncbi:MAG: hypothetical protein EBX52_14840, partial [Proteobacteria bacterium]|nr:hypothetical protein [Pseudomonadota bacterium]
YEPRGLAQNLAYALLTLPFVPGGRLKYLAVPLFLFTGFGFSFSYTGILVLLSGLGLLVITRFLCKSRGTGGSTRSWLAGLIAVPLLLALTLSFLPRSSKDYIAARFNYLSEKGFAEKFEVFDAAAINFFMHHPEHLVLGTGPGLIYLPASEYIVERDKPIWGHRFDALPHMGSVLVISNTGLAGLALLAIPFLIALGRRLRRPDDLLFLGSALFGLFFVQIRYYSLFGIAALLSKSEDGVSGPEVNP